VSREIRVYSSPRYVADIGEHVMPMRKFDRVRGRNDTRGSRPPCVF